MGARKRRLDRDLLFVAIPATLFVVVAIGLTLLLMRPAPPSEIVMSTGAAEGSYHTYALKYRDILAREVGIPYGAVNSSTTLHPTTVTNYGGSQPHENRQPYLVINFIIALSGIFPSQN